MTVYRSWRAGSSVRRAELAVLAGALATSLAGVSLLGNLVPGVVPRRPVDGRAVATSAGRLPADVSVSATLSSTRIRPPRAEASPVRPPSTRPGPVLAPDRPVSPAPAIDPRLPTAVEPARRPTGRALPTTRRDSAAPRSVAAAPVAPPPSSTTPAPAATPTSPTTSAPADRVTRFGAVPPAAGQPVAGQPDSPSDPEDASPTAGPARHEDRAKKKHPQKHDRAPRRPAAAEGIEQDEAEGSHDKPRDDEPRDDESKDRGADQDRGADKEREVGRKEEKSDS
ncbi:MAG TPA: hypothetical protein VNB94_01465 [Mycobacteriales bacterium]|nr:hypothetical protein [Mycobacteriales bacterium]